jgi:hypothetical protein
MSSKQSQQTGYNSRLGRYLYPVDNHHSFGILFVQRKYIPFLIAIEFLGGELIDAVWSA